MITVYVCASGANRDAVQEQWMKQKSVQLISAGSAPNPLFLTKYLTSFSCSFFFF